MVCPSVLKKTPTMTKYISKERMNEIRKEMRIEQDIYGINDTKDFATRIAEEEQILKMSHEESKRAKAERLEKERIRQQQDPRHNQYGFWGDPNERK